MPELLTKSYLRKALLVQTIVTGVMVAVAFGTIGILLKH